MRPGLHLLLILLIAATSLSLGSARGQARVAGQMVLCDGHGVTTVAVDASGNPVERVVICPDMALSLLAALDVPPPELPRRLAAVLVVPLPAARDGAGLSVIVNQPRGPPASSALT
ncbi:hypothetical protein KTN05_00305 [Paracoccus sp. Z118]|uniref:hypothetical protein n=1 Tax=Paracoccus sp. Z118 TaxID=2851017 RepID=UPI001C2C1F70|nr:hypothetical protein [Paracoccus sp. Z118]MBV0890297.1 hypothetical protein [Paracoccus sp. Z118]